MAKRLRSLVCILIFVLMLIVSGCDIKPLVIPSSEVEYEEATFGPMDETDILGDITLPPNDKQVKWTLLDEGALVTIDAGYEDISLEQAMSFLDELEENYWYLAGNSAYKGACYVEISYSMETRMLELHFARDKAASEWPEGVLTPYLSTMAPPFPYGKFIGYTEEEWTYGEATRLTYTGVTPDEMDEYIALLKGIGMQQGMTTLFYIDHLCISHGFKDGVAEIVVGLNNEIQLVPLPPWPESLPENLRKILPPIGAVMDASEGKDGFFVSAEQMTLTDMHSFFSSATQNGWSPLSEAGEMLHEESGYGIKMVMYKSDSQVWIVNIFNISEKQTEGPTSPIPTPQEDMDATEYVFILTEGRYTEESAMEGIKSEFGELADMADWNEIVSIYGDDFTSFLESAGVISGEDVWVKSNGHFSDGGRYYFLAFINGQQRQNFLLYGNVGNEAWLGSWYGLELRVLVKVPMDQLPEILTEQTDTETSPLPTDDETDSTEYRFVLTEGSYPEHSVILGVFDEFGQFADIADWNEIVSIYGNNFSAFLEDVGAESNEDIWIKYGGSRNDGNRYYFLAFINGQPRSDFLKYSYVGNEAWLGSWHGLELRVLVKVPADQLP